MNANSKKEIYLVKCESRNKLVLASSLFVLTADLLIKKITGMVTINSYTNN